MRYRNWLLSQKCVIVIATGHDQRKMVAMSMLKGTSRKQAFLQKQLVSIKHFCQQDQSQLAVSTSNYKLIYDIVI